MAKSQEINLDMLKRLVSTLEDLIASATEIRTRANQGADVKDYFAWASPKSPIYW